MFGSRNKPADAVMRPAVVATAGNGSLGPVANARKDGVAATTREETSCQGSLKGRGSGLRRQRTPLSRVVVVVVLVVVVVEENDDVVEGVYQELELLVAVAAVVTSACSEAASFRSSWAFWV